MIQNIDMGLKIIRGLMIQKIHMGLKIVRGLMIKKLGLKIARVRARPKLKCVARKKKVKRERII